MDWDSKGFIKIFVTMENYSNYLQSMYSEKTFNRKLDYIKYNFWSFFDEKTKNILEIWPWLWEFIVFSKSNKLDNITIIDNDESVLEYCNKKHKITESFLIKNSIKEIDNSLKKYDIIFMNQILEHITKSEQIETLKILYKHLNIWWKLIINVPNAGNYLTMTEIYADITHTTAFTDNSLKEIAMQISDQKDKITIKSYKIPPYNWINIIRIVLQKILHSIQLLMYIAHGWSFSKILTPNISLIIQRN